VLQWNYPGRITSFFVTCSGRVWSDGGLSRVTLRIRQSTDFWFIMCVWMGLLFAQMMFTGRWLWGRFLVGTLALGALIGVGLALSYRPGRGDEEANELEHLLFEAIGPLADSHKPAPEA